MKKILATILAVSMLLSMCVFASAEDETVAYAVEGGNIYFDPTTGTITDADEGITSAVIPSEISGVAVTRIGSDDAPSALSGCTSLESVTIPEGVTSIGWSAFLGCTSLTSVTIPSSVTGIDGEAFVGCTSLTSITIPEGVTGIGTRVFSGCRSLTSITIPSGVTSIGTSAFMGCTSLASITIPSSVTSIGEYAFQNCTSLTSIEIPSSVTAIYWCVFEGCTSLASVTIPDSVTYLDWGVFNGCTSLESITIPESVTYIAHSMFEDCTSLTSVTIPESVTGIGMGVFYGCDSLADVYYGGSEEEWSAIDVNDWRNDPLLNATIHYGKPSPSPTPTAYASTQTVDIDGKAVELQAYALKDENGNPTNYVKLRDVAHVLSGTAAQFEVGWDGAVNIITGSPYTPNGSEMSTPFSGDRAYTVPTAVTNINGTPAALDAIKLTDDNGGGYTYYKLRDLGRALGFNVSWSAERGIYLETDKPYTEDDANGETETDSTDETTDNTVLDATSLDLIGTLKLVEEFVMAQGGETRIVGGYSYVSTYRDREDYIRRYLEKSPAVAEFSCNWDNGHLAVEITEYAEVDADTDYTVYYDTYLDDKGSTWVEVDVEVWHLYVGGEMVSAVDIRGLSSEQHTAGIVDVASWARYWHSSFGSDVSASDQTAEDIAPRPMIP